MSNISSAFHREVFDFLMEHRAKHPFNFLLQQDEAKLKEGRLFYEEREGEMSHLKVILTLSTLAQHPLYGNIEFWVFEDKAWGIFFDVGQYKTEALKKQAEYIFKYDLEGELGYINSHLNLYVFKQHGFYFEGLIQAIEKVLNVVSRKYRVKQLWYLIPDSEFTQSLERINAFAPAAVVEESASGYGDVSGTEPEDEGEGSDFSDPFDPKDISIQSKNMAMDTCLRRMIQNSLILNPDFQRREVWTKEKKSQLIESLMLKIPLPMFYVASNEDGVWTVVDGLQRLSTIRDFILGKAFLESKDEAQRGDGFRLDQLEFWKQLEGCTFKELPVHIQNSILETEFSFTIINPGTPEEVKRNIFKRINTGGMPLSSQEIRNALYAGASTELLNELAEHTAFKEATAYSIRDERMADKELILRFLAFLIRDYSSYTQSQSIDGLLSDSMIILNAIPHQFNQRDFLKASKRKNNPLHRKDVRFDDLQKIKHYFIVGMQRAHALFGKHCFRKSIEGQKRTPINKVLFEVWGVSLALLPEADFELLKARKAHLLEQYKTLMASAGFYDNLNKSRMETNAVHSRFKAIYQLIQDSITP